MFAVQNKRGVADGGKTMTLEIWLAYTIAAIVIVLIPGPTILAVVAQSFAHGRASVLPLVLGVTCGDIVALGLSVAGLGALLAASAAWFAAVKWAGAAYLVYLGVSLWRTPKSGLASESFAAASVAVSPRKLFFHAFFITTFNPKGIIFFIAFLPQFVNPNADVPAQLFILSLTFVIVGSLSALLYAVFSGSFRRSLSARKHRWFNRCGGGALVAAGAWTAAAQRA